MRMFCRGEEEGGVPEVNSDPLYSGVHPEAISLMCWGYYICLPVLRGRGEVLLFKTSRSLDARGGY